MIYTDVFGRPEPKASISAFGTNYGQPGTGYFALTSVAVNAPDRRWPYVSRDVSDIVAEMDADGWDCVVTTDGYGAPRINLTHRETQRVIDTATRKMETEFANAERGYIRFGKCPKSGRSVNHRDNSLEAGVSVFKAEFVGKKYRLIFDNHILESSYLSVSDRPAYRVYGDVVGTGADGEPVLKVRKAVRL